MNRYMMSKLNMGKYLIVTEKIQTTKENIRMNGAESLRKYRLNEEENFICKPP